MDEVTDFEARPLTNDLTIITGVVQHRKIGALVAPELAEDETFAKGWLLKLAEEYLP